jgi:hypothetical protein
VEVQTYKQKAKREAWNHVLCESVVIDVLCDLVEFTYCVENREVTKDNEFFCRVIRQPVLKRLRRAFLDARSVLGLGPNVK